MRDAATRFKCKRLFVLGAGASFAASANGKHNAPLDRDFTSVIADLNYDKPQWIGHAKRSILQAYKGPGKFQQTGLEDAVIRQLGHLEFLSRIHPRRARDLQTSDDFLNHLNGLICTVLSRCRSSTNNLYASLASQVCSNRDVNRCKDRIITFNYDTLLDSEMGKYFDWPLVYFDDIRASRTSPASAATSCPLLLKLHGSINWRCKRSELSAALAHDRKAPDPYRIGKIWLDHGRPDPDSDYVPLIVPPLPDKPITTVGILRYLWRKAYEYLHEAEQLFIVGYSLPPTDRMAVSMFSNFSNDNIKSVHIADPNGSMINKWRAVLNRKGVEVKEWRYAEDFGEMVASL